MQKNTWWTNPGSWRIFACLFIICTLSSCKSKKLLTANTKPTEKVADLASNKVITNIQANQLDFKTFNAKAKSALAINKDYYDASLTIRIKNKEAIWISITTILNIEAARVLITPNRFKMMNRLNGTYIDQPFSFIHRFTSPSINFADLQALLIGDPISKIFSYTDRAEQNNMGYALDGQDSSLVFHIQTNADFRPITNELTTINGGKQINSNYTAFSKLEHQQIAKTVLISALTTALKLDMQVNYNQIILNEPIEAPFNIPTKYKELK